MPIVKPVGGFSVEAELIDKISKKLDTIDREIDDITSRRIAADKAAAAASQSAAKSATMGWTEFRSAYSTVLDIVRVGQQAWAATGQEFVNYAEQVKNMSRTLGASAEETSRIIQVADDVRISYDSLKVAMKEAQKDGIEPNIENLAKLADQYKAIQSPAERTKFLLETFGKSGLEMGKLMEQGGDSIREMSDAIDESLIITEKGIQKSDEYQESLDTFNDTLEGVKIAFGEVSIGPATDFLKIITADLQAVSDLDGALKALKEGGLQGLSDWAAKIVGSNFPQFLKDLGFGVKGYSDEADEAAQNTQDLTEYADENSGVIDNQKDAIKAAEQALKDYKDALEAVSRANQDAERFMQSYADFQKNYEESHADAVQRLNEAMKEGDSEAIAEARGAIQELEAQWHESTQKMIYDMAMAKVSIGGLTDAEFRATQELAVQMGIRTQAQADEAIAMMEKATAIADGIAMQEDVVNEKADADAKLLELEAAKEAAAAQTTQTVIDGNSAAIQSEQSLASSVDATSEAFRRQAEAARYAAAAALYQGSSGGSTGGGSAGGKNKGSNSVGGRKQHESGGQFVVPSQYGREGFALGNYGTASAGETITVTPKGQAAGGTYNITINNPKRESTEDSMRTFFNKMRYLGVAA